MRGAASLISPSSIRATLRLNFAKQSATAFSAVTIVWPYVRGTNSRKNPARRVLPRAPGPTTTLSATHPMMARSSSGLESVFVYRLNTDLYISNRHLDSEPSDVTGRHAAWIREGCSVIASALSLTPGFFRAYVHPNSGEGTGGGQSRPPAIPAVVIQGPVPVTMDR